MFYTNIAAIVETQQLASTTTAVCGAATRGAKPTPTDPAVSVVTPTPGASTAPSPRQPEVAAAVGQGKRTVGSTAIDSVRAGPSAQPAKAGGLGVSGLPATGGGGTPPTRGNQLALVIVIALLVSGVFLSLASRLTSGPSQ
jgi:hypothetical protein